MDFREQGSIKFCILIINEVPLLMKEWRGWRDFEYTPTPSCISPFIRGRKDMRI
jgi:hypothetical protein